MGRSSSRRAEIKAERRYALELEQRKARRAKHTAKARRPPPLASLRGAPGARYRDAA